MKTLHHFFIESILHPIYHWLIFLLPLDVCSLILYIVDSVISRLKMADYMTANGTEVMSRFYYQVVQCRYTSTFRGNKSWTRFTLKKAFLIGNKVALLVDDCVVKCRKILSSHILELDVVQVEDGVGSESTSSSSRYATITGDGAVCWQKEIEIQRRKKEMLEKNRVGCMLKDEEGKTYQKGGCGGFGKGNFSELFKFIEEYEKTLESKRISETTAA
ncbi:hypothetical protein LWI29_033761 [Acer saccharum]|uniref:Uncharacterized protein n=1 Tax=Acer saccharum TaxID=4024 RepID=A0AA39TAP8_ACESA|nr:hypothetical protein LWI29_033761 [Acer saccharum]